MQHLYAPAARTARATRQAVATYALTLLILLLPWVAQAAVPTITSFTPTSGFVGTSVTLTGTNLTGATSVRFNGTAQATITANTATTLTVAVPTGATTGTLTVTTAGGTSAASSQAFTVIQPPTIGYFWPASGPVGSTVVISGSNFNATAAQNVVFFGATRATVTAASTSSLTVTVPAGATYQYLSVTNLATGLTVNSATPFVVTLNGGGFFRPAADAIAGTAPYAVALGDLDGDGKPELVVANYFGNTVSVLRNTSAGTTATFAAKADFATGGSPFAVVVGDVDGDGKPDLALSSSGSNVVSVLRNTSTGAGVISFATKVDVATGSGPRGLALGDLDFDGKPDLAAANQGSGLSGTVSVLHNTSVAGTISFAPKVDLTSGSSPRWVTIGDVDGDGRPDLATANTGTNPGLGNAGSVAVLRNSCSTAGVLSFDNKVDVVFGTNPYVVAIGDIDGDGKTDLTTANFSSNAVSVLRSTSAGTGSISFAAGVDVPVGTSPVALTLADVDGNGLPDVVTANNGGSGSASVLRNTSTAGAISFYSKVDAPAGSLPRGVTVGDLNGDGRPDVAVANSGGTSGTTVSVIQQDPTVSFSPASGPVGTSVTLTGGGFSTTAAQNVVFFGATRATVTAANASGLTVTVPVGATYQYLSVTNLTTGLTAYSAKPFAVTLNGALVFRPKVDVATSNGFNRVVVGDVDGDGKADLAVANGGGSGSVSVLRNTSTPGTVSFAAKVDVPAGSSTSDVAIGDLDGDGLLDLAVANPGPVPLTGSPVVGTMSVLRNISTPGTISFAARQNIPNLGPMPFLVALGDADGDGRPDLAVVSHGGNIAGGTTYTSSGYSATSIVSALRNTSTPGAISFAPRLDIHPGSDPESVAFGDVDGDGKPELVLADDVDNTVSVQRNTSVAGTLSFGAKQVYATGADPGAVAFGDLDGDGKPELSVANNGGTTVSVLRNTSTVGTISLAAKVDVPAGTGPRSLALSDVDGDGKTDLAVTSSIGGSNAVAVLSNTSTAGTLSFSTPVTAQTGISAYPVAVGDLDGDNRPDLAEVNYGSGVALVSVIRQAAVLTNLSLSAGTLSPAFAAGTLSYSATVSSTTSSITVTPTASVPAISITVNGTVVASGSPSGPIALAIGSNTITVVYDGATYTVIVTRGCPAPVAVAQNTSITLDASGTATVAATAVNNGSTADCNPAPASALSVSPSTFTCANLGANTVTLTVTDASGNTSTATATVTVSTPALTNTTWTGTASADPQDCRNWSYGKVPDAGTDAAIPATSPFAPNLATGTLSMASLTIASGNSLTVGSSATLQVSGDFINNGTATLSGTVAFAGSAATQTLNNPSSFATLVVNKPSGTVQLARTLSVTSALTLTSGTLTTTASYQVNLGGLATLSETDASYVLGNVLVSRLLAPGTAQSFNGLGLTLTPAAGSTAPGATLVTRTTGTAINGAGSSQSILRSFNIQPTVNAGLNVAMDFAYFAHELNGISAANLALFKSVNGGTPWIPQRGTTMAGNVLTKTGITDFSIWTLGNSAAPLPVELTDFTATLVDNTSVRVAWATASEKNSVSFDVERSLDGIAFARIGTVVAAGSSSAPHSYGFEDNKLPGSVLLYYRLKQVDQDGTASYSPVRSVVLSGKAGLLLYPNPAHSTATLTGMLPGTVATVFDALGRFVTAATADAAGTATLVLPDGLPTGVYVVRAGSKALRLAVK